jgi:hypothetical protein
LPGELYVNWPDSQLGAINSGGNPQDLIAVRFFSTLANYNVGDFTINGGQLYRATAAVTAGAFNSAQWTQVGGSVSVSDSLPTNPQPGSLWWDSVGGQLYVYFNDGNTSQWVIANNFNGGAYLPLSGGTLTGDLTLAADPVNALDAATKEYVDNSEATLWQNIRYRNRIINGDMSVDQRNGGNIIAANGGYVIDRWKLGTNITSKGNVGQAGVGPPGQAVTGGFQFCLGWQTTTAYAPAAADSLFWLHPVEGCNFNDAMWGTPNAQPVMLEFWATGSVAGTYAVALRNAGSPPTRSYVATFTLPAVTWTKVRLTIPGDQSGTWAVAANASALQFGFNLGGGSNFATTPGAWQAGNFYTAAGVVNPVATLNANLYITGVALMVGVAAANAEPEFRKYSDNLLDCQRYFVSGPTNLIQLRMTAVAANASYQWYWYAPVVLRGAPTINSTFSSASNVSANPVAMYNDLRTLRCSINATAAGDMYTQWTIGTLDADF